MNRIKDFIAVAAEVISIALFAVVATIVLSAALIYVGHA
jgi:hypothetical protein